MVHVELCSRLSMELGGGSEIRYQPSELVYEPSRELSPLMYATELVVHNFCVGKRCPSRSCAAPPERPNSHSPARC